MGQVDIGVTPGIVMRNFVQSDNLFDSKLQQVPWSEASWRDRKAKLMTRAEQLADLERVQACRPLRRPGTREWEVAMAAWKDGS